MSISSKLMLFLLVQAAGTLAALGAYFLIVGGDTQRQGAVLSLANEDARLLHRRIDRAEFLGPDGRAAVLAFANRMDRAIEALRRGGEYQGIPCKPAPVELLGLLDEIHVQWKRTRPALLKVGTSNEAEEKELRTKLHEVYPRWQAAVDRMQKSVGRREMTVRTHMTSTFLLVGAVDVISLLAIMVLVRRFISQPIREVQKAASRVASGDYLGSVPVTGRDEVGMLAAEFNRMSGQLHEAVGSLRDSEARLSEKAEALARSNRELEQYAYAAAHDLQEPARIMSLYVQLLSRRVDLPPEAAEYADEIQRSADRMQRLVQALLVHSQSVHQTPTSEATDAGRAASEALQFLQESVRSSGAAVSVEALPRVMASDTDLELVFRNLISNALKYCGDKPPRVEISAQNSDGLCRICVRDEGIGIAPEYHERVFGLFRRLHGHEVPGTGVGLAVVRNLVEKHGGRIWVESEPGRGSAFYFELQAADGAASAAA